MKSKAAIILNNFRLSFGPSMTLRKFATILGVSISALHKWEEGHRRPRADIIARFSDLGIVQPQDWFVIAEPNISEKACSQCYRSLDDESINGCLGSDCPRLMFLEKEHQAA